MRGIRSTVLRGIFLFAGAGMATWCAGPAYAGNASAAKSRVTQAKSNLDDGRTDQAEDALNAAEKFLDGLSDAEKAPIEKDITALREKLTAAQKAEASARVEKSVKRILDMAEQETVPGNAERMIESAVRTFEGDDAKKNLADPARKQLQARIDAMQKKYGMAGAGGGGGGGGGTATPEVKKPEPAVTGSAPPEAKKMDKPEPAGKPAALDEEGQRILSSIKRTLNYAEQESNASSGENFLEQARTQLGGDVAKAKLDAATIKELQGRIDADHAKFAGAMNAGEAKRLVEYMESQLRAADGAIGHDPGFAQTRLNYVTERLATDEYQQKIDAATIKRLADQQAALQTKLAGSNKAMALRNAEPILKELEQKVVSDPYQGVEVGQTYKVVGELTSLRARVMDKIHDVPGDDADRKAIEARLAAVAKKIEGYDSAWSDARVEDAVAQGWTFTKSGFEGWEGEAWAPGQRPFEPIKMQKTIQAIRGTNYWLGEKETKAAIDKHSSLPKVVSTLADAKKVLADAGAKLNGAFNQWMDAAEKQARPQGATRFELGSAKQMAYNAKEWFEGTPYADANVARATKLDERWQAELAAIKKQHEEALAKLTGEAKLAWPAIETSCAAQDGFSPSDVAKWKGKTVRFKGVRNRTGWDFDGQYDLVIWVDSKPLAGNYAPKVRQAFHDASEKIGDIVEDHQDWDVIAVIDGVGTVNQRYTTEVKAADMTVLGKIEGSRPVECVLIKVIAVHAGPVAVGP